MYSRMYALRSVLTASTALTTGLLTTGHHGIWVPWQIMWADAHSAFRQQILDVTQAESEPEVESNCLVDNLGRETIPAVA